MVSKRDRMTIKDATKAGEVRSKSRRFAECCFLNQRSQFDTRAVKELLRLTDVPPFSAVRLLYDNFDSFRITNPARPSDLALVQALAPKFTHSSNGNFPKCR